jgi:hypothetical protein
MKEFYPDPQLNAVANEVLKYMPSLAPFYASEESLSDYSRRINSYTPSETHLKRQARFKKKLQEKIERIFNKEELSDMKLPIDEKWGVVGGIVDHSGILDHPWLLAVHLVSNFYKLLHRDTEGDILTFATGNVPLREPFRRGGFMLNGKKINLFPKGDKNKVVYGLPTYDLDFVKRLKFESHQWHTFTPEEQATLDKIQSVIHAIDFSTCTSLGDQWTKINYHIWPFLFEEKLRGNAARLVAIEYDDIVIDYMVQVLQSEPESFVHQMLFDDAFRDKVLRKFQGAVGAWSEEGGTGTHFFWGLDEKNEHVRLELRDNYLVGDGGNFKVEFTPEGVSQKLLEKKLLPGMLLKFSLIMFYMGMKPLAGYSLEYLTRMKQNIVEVLEEDFPEEAKLAREVPLDNMNLISICQGRDAQGVLKELHAFDIFYRGGFKEEYFTKLDACAFKEFMIPPLLFAYTYGIGKYGTASEKKEFAITEADLQKTLEKIF